MTERTYTADEVDSMIARAVIKAKHEQLYELLGNPEQLEFAKIIRADEREECAKVCERYNPQRVGYLVLIYGRDLQGGFDD
jgi:hypothetical protein